MRCTGSLNDRRVQGLLDVQFNIDGRTRITELERFLNEVIARGKKIISIGIHFSQSIYIITNVAIYLTIYLTIYLSIYQQFIYLLILAVIHLRKHMIPFAMNLLIMKNQVMYSSNVSI
jgi:hypothetical protein